MSITPFSGVTDKSPLSPAWFNGKFAEIYSQLSSLDTQTATAFGITKSGSTITFLATDDVVLRSIDSGGFGINVLAYGADPTGVTSSNAAIVSAISAANGRVHQVMFPAGRYLVDSTISLGPSIGGIKLIGAGRYASIITSTVNGDVFTLNTGTGFGFQSLGIHIGGGPASGNSKAIGAHIIGNTNEFTVRDCEFLSIGSFGILFEAATGSGTLISDSIFYAAPSSVTTMSSGQSNIAAIGQRGADVSACPRYIVNSIGLGGTDLWNLDTPNDMIATNCFFRNAVVTGASGNVLNVQYQGTRLATTGYPTYLRGGNPVMIGANHAGNVIIASGANNAYVATSAVSGIQDQSSSSGSNFIMGGYYNLGPGFFTNLGQVQASGGSVLSPNYAWASETSLGLYRSGVSTMALSYGTLNLNQSRLVSARTLAASAVTTSAANTNVIANEVVFTVGGASGASLAIHSGGTVYIFNSALSAKAT